MAFLFLFSDVNLELGVLTIKDLGRGVGGKNTLKNNHDHKRVSPLFPGFLLGLSSYSPEALKKPQWSPNPRTYLLDLLPLLVTDLFLGA